MPGLRDEVDCAFWECDDLLATEFESVDPVAGFEVGEAAADGGFRDVEDVDDIALPESSVVRPEERDDSLFVWRVWVVQVGGTLDSLVSWREFGREGHPYHLCVEMYRSGKGELTNASKRPGKLGGFASGGVHALRTVSIRS